MLGFIGFGEYKRAAGRPAGVFDLAYRDLQLFVLQSGDPDNSGAKPVGIPVALNAARFLAPAVGAGALLAVIAALLRDQLQRARLRFIRGHVVVCGAGGKGTALASSLREHGYRVVAVEREIGNPNIVSCAAAGMPVVVGNATQTATLRRTGVPRAAQVAVCGDSGANAEVAAAVHDVAVHRRQPLDCLVHVDEPRLCDLLQTRYLATRCGSVRMDFFNAFERGAQVLLIRHPFFHEDAAPETGVPHVLVVGLGRLGQNLVVQAARNWRACGHSLHQRFRVTAVDRHATPAARSLAVANPELGGVCDLVPAETDVNGPAFETGAFLPGSGGATRPTIAYVCLDDDGRALRAGLAPHRWLHRVPIIVVSQTETGVPALLRTEGEKFEELRSFALLDRGCDADLLLGGAYELLARALHEEYAQHREAQGWSYGPELNHDRRSDHALAPWQKLPDDLRESNRSQAAHTGAKLAAVGCTLEPLTNWDAGLFSFTDEDRTTRRTGTPAVGKRARGGGLEAGAERSRTPAHPYLVAYDRLPEQIKEYDRMFVRNPPRILAKIGQQVVREPGPGRGHTTFPAADRPPAPMPTTSQSARNRTGLTCRCGRAAATDPAGSTNEGAHHGGGH